MRDLCSEYFYIFDMNTIQSGKKKDTERQHKMKPNDVESLVIDAWAEKEKWKTQSQYAHLRRWVTQAQEIFGFTFT